MRTRGLKKQIIFSFFAVILVVAVLFAVMAYYVVEHNIVSRAEGEVLNAIEAAKTIYRDRLEQIKKAWRQLTGLKIMRRLRAS